MRALAEPFSTTELHPTQIDQMLASSGISATAGPTASGAGIYEDATASPERSRAPSPATIAQMALAASRNPPSVPPSAGPSRRSSPSDLGSDHLRETLVGVMRTKDALEKEVGDIRQLLDSAKLAGMTLTQEKADMAGRLEALEQQVAMSGDNRSHAEQALAKENSLLKQQLKKYVAENQQVRYLIVWCCAIGRS